MESSCRANQYAFQNMSQASKSLNISAWDGHAHEKRFMEALANFMNESWAVVCQVRERAGLCSEYTMSSTEINKRIDDVSQRLNEKYKEVQALEAQKASLLNKKPSGPDRKQPVGHVPSQTPASYAVGNVPCPSMPYPAGISGNQWQSTTAPSNASRNRMQFTGSSAASGAPCPPSCPEYSQEASRPSGALRSYGGYNYEY